MPDWNTYHTQTKNNPPRPILVEALSYCSRQETALDLGAGALNESRYLAELSWHVIAIDSSPSTPKFEKNIDTQVMPIEDYSYPVSSFDLVASLYTLPFLAKDDISTIMQKIQNSLREGGIFVGQFFGEHDDWRACCATHSREEITNLLKSMQIIKLEEEDRDRATASGKMKHWHVFHVIARKA